MPAVTTTSDPTLLSLRRSTGLLASAALRRMEGHAWYRALEAQDRSWVGLVAQAGISAFISWYEQPAGTARVTTDIFGTAPRELTRSVSLQQTLELVRVVVDVVEDHAAEVAAAGDEQGLRESVLRYSREVAFAAAQVYAAAAEARGAWDARLEALVVDALVRGESDDALHSRAAALGWTGGTHVVTVVGSTPPGPTEVVIERLRRQARALRADALIGVHGERLVVVLGCDRHPAELLTELATRFGPGPVVSGPVVEELAEAGRSARTAAAGLVAARAWPAAPRPVPADDLLPERLMSGDGTARRALVDRIYRPLHEHDTPLLVTVAAYLESGRSIEAAARTLFVHPNTVRYRLTKAAAVTGWDPTDPRDGFVIQVAVSAGRLAVPAGRE